MLAQYASYGCMPVCVSLSVTNRCSVKKSEMISWFLRASLPLSYHTLCYKEICSIHPDVSIEHQLVTDVRQTLTDRYTAIASTTLAQRRASKQL